VLAVNLQDEITATDPSGLLCRHRVSPHSGLGLTTIWRASHAGHCLAAIGLKPVPAEQISADREGN